MPNASAIDGLAFINNARCGTELYMSGKSGATFNRLRSLTLDGPGYPDNSISAR